MFPGGRAIAFLVESGFECQKQMVSLFYAPSRASGGSIQRTDVIKLATLETGPGYYAGCHSEVFKVLA